MQAVNEGNIKIHVEDLKKSFHKLQVLRGISTDIYEGEVVVIIGPSGSGKSTFLRCLNHLEQIDSGKVVAGNIDHYFGFHTPITSGVDIPPAQTIGKPAWGRVNMRERTAGDRKEDFNLMEACLTDEEAAQECSRCLRCDHYGYGAFRGGRKDRW